MITKTQVDTMTLIRQEDFIQSIADALQYISYYHPLDFIQALNKAYKNEQSPAAKDAMAQILINSRLCAEGKRPICQDTGIVVVFLKIGMDVQWASTLSITDMVNEGVRRAYSHPDNVLRASVLSDPAGKRINTGDNTPAVVHTELVLGDTVEVEIAAKGGGSEAKSKFENCTNNGCWLVSTWYFRNRYWRHSRKSDAVSQTSLYGIYRYTGTTSQRRE